MKKTLVLFILALLVFSGLAVAGGQQEGASFPAKTITYIIPFDPGGQSDRTALYQKEDLQRILGVNVMMKYLPGAGGAVGWANLVKSAPDGYTICGNNLPHIILQPLVRDNAGYETMQLEPVYLFQSTPIGLAVLKDSSFKTLDDFLAYAKENPGKVTIGGSGTWSGHHIALLQLQQLTGVEFTYIPSTGAAPSVANFLGGHTMALFANSDDLVTHRDKINVLAIGTEKEFEGLPGVPTFREQGVKMTAGIDRGVCVPPGTPESVIKTLEDAFDEVCNLPAYVGKMKEEGFLIQNMKSKKFKKYLEEKTEEYTQILRDLGEID
jgi:tripartite-type tricarboxylate transporter receptor subunit TctC